MYQEGRISPNDSQFYCCFGRCHALKGAKVIAIIFAVNYALSTAFSLVSLVNGYPTNTGVCLIGVLVVGCLWHGLTKEREGFLIPFLIYIAVCMVMTGVALVVLTVFIPIVFVGADYLDENEIRRQFNHGSVQSPPMDIIGENPSMLRPILFLMLAIMAVSFSLSVLVFCTVKKAYSYIKQKRWANFNGNMQVFIAVPQMEQGYAPKGDMPPPTYEETYMKKY